MQLPIYQSDQHSLPQLTQANVGLRFERFFDGYDLNNHVDLQPKPDPKKEDPKTVFIKKIANATCGNEPALQAAAFRQIKLSQAAHGDYQVFKLDGHFVTGMGNSHPVENGFLWHYTLGTPYLAGSQVKGLVRSLIEQFYADSDRTKVLMQWFGSEAKDPNQTEEPNRAGELIFFDAIPIEPPHLSVDIMTPHMKDWYAEGANIKDSKQDSDKIPADWHEPVPVPFLACKHAAFLFSIGKRAGSQIKIQEVFDCLEQALKFLGAGGKTQTGYGYMQVDHQQLTDLKTEFTSREKDAREKAQFEQQTANASPLFCALLTDIKDNQWDENNDTAKSSFTAAIDQWLEKLAANPNEQECIQQFIKIANIHYAAQIKNPEGKKVKPNQKAWILRMLDLTKSS